jgi:hypothetical protein
VKIERRKHLKVSEIKEEVQKKYHEGQEVILWNDEERGEPVPYKVKIITFNPNSVLVQRKSWKESYTYFDFMRLSVKPDKRPVIPASLKKSRGARHRKACVESMQY